MRTRVAGAYDLIKNWLAKETEGMSMGKKESNVRPENAVKPDYPGVSPIGESPMNVGMAGNRSGGAIPMTEEEFRTWFRRVMYPHIKVACEDLFPNKSPVPPTPPLKWAKPAARRDDGGKLKWHLVPIPALLGLVKVFHGGALKYAEEQWRGGMKFSRIYRSMISHFMKWLASNNSYDKELGTHHLMMVAWGCFVLYMYEVVYKFTQYDDRPEKGLLTDEDFEFVSLMIDKRLSEKDLENLTTSWKDRFTVDKDDAAR